MKSTRLVHGVLVACVAVLVACGAAVNDGGAVDAGLGQRTGGGAPDATAGGAAGQGGGAAGGSVGNAAGGMALAAMYPTWTLTDLQPLSPRANETYGLSAFAGRPLVVVLIEGF